MTFLELLILCIYLAFLHPLFAAANLERVQRYSPEDLNMSAIVDKQAELSPSIAIVEKVENTVNKVLDPIKEQISPLTNIVIQLTVIRHHDCLVCFCHFSSHYFSCV